MVVPVKKHVTKKRLPKLNVPNKNGEYNDLKYIQDWLLKFKYDVDCHKYIIYYKGPRGLRTTELTTIPGLIRHLEKNYTVKRGKTAGKVVFFNLYASYLKPGKNNPEKDTILVMKGAEEYAPEHEELNEPHTTEAEVDALLDEPSPPKQVIQPPKTIIREVRTETNDSALLQAFNKVTDLFERVINNRSVPTTIQYEPNPEPRPEPSEPINKGVSSLTEVKRKDRTELKELVKAELAEKKRLTKKPVSRKSTSKKTTKKKVTKRPTPRTKRGKKVTKTKAKKRK